MITNARLRTRWVHTNIEAPYPFSVTGFNQLSTGRGVAFSAELVHPNLGVVGCIANGGYGGSTTFSPYDHTRFGKRNLEEFLRRCRQDGQPMDTGPVGMETLLNEIVNETETAGIVADMRATSQFVVRSRRPRETASSGPRRGAPLVYRGILLRRTDREDLAAELARDPAERLPAGAYWQMFDGLEWTPLLGEPPLAPEQINARLRRADQLTAGAPDRDTRLNAVPFDDQFHLSGTPAARFTLTGDATSRLCTDSWCQCARRKATVRFERWNGTTLEESGVVHAARRCRRLVRID
ncbi:hypothetical protein [Saccharopolyspora erythraea]|uniref:hypothetical protein n=1 Tax=Saccharopolyspora erythraea TaxID=1836 RepID=UPI002012746F|nr:hypothetical protein [Saccharopolyspora erythraea]